MANEILLRERAQLRVRSGARPLDPPSTKRFGFCIPDPLVRKSRAKRKQIIMRIETTDQPMLKSIQCLAAEEDRLFTSKVCSDADRVRLCQLNVELDQCWDLLRQRKALREAGRNPNEEYTASAGDLRKLRRMI